MSAPAKCTPPCCGRSVPETTLKSVVLPAPLGPTRPTISSAATVSETPSSARRPPKRTATSRSSSIFGHGVIRRALGPAAKPRREGRDEPFRRQEDHRGEQRAEHDLVTDRHHG